MPLNPASADDAQRRLRLRVAAKLMIYLAVAGVFYIFIVAIRTEEGKLPSVPGLRVALTDLQPGTARLLVWEGRPVILYRRRQSDIASLHAVDERLLDPQSVRSDQPERFVNDLRSESPDLFVAIALGTDLGCSLDYLPAGGELFQGKRWAGGFADSCRDSRYDLAGRVYKWQYSSRNLVVPPYSVSADVLILGR